MQIKTRRRFASLFSSVIFPGLLVAAAVTAQAASTPVAVGTLSFEQLSPGDPGPAVNYFLITNYTGSNAIDPDFPILDPFTFSGLSMLLQFTGGGTASLPACPSSDPCISDVGPGDSNAGGDPPPVLTFADSSFISARLVGTFATGLTLLDDYSFTFDLTPSGDTLQPGDSVTIFAQVTDQVSATPEPASFLLAGVGLVGLLGVTRLGASRKFLK